jgi:glycosyltransferase involved in cell wall biosynthesis
MKILILCNKSPYPPKEGGPIAMNAIIEGLCQAGHQVKVLAINSNKYSVDVSNIPESYRQKTNIETVYIDLSIKPLDAFINLFTGKSYHVERFISKDFENKLTEILKQDDYEIVQLEMLHMSPYIETIRKYSKAKVVLRSHNIEHLIWERVACISQNPLKKIYLKHLAKTLRNFELTMLNQYDGIATITKKDGETLRELGCRIPLIDIPFGIDLATLKENPGVEPEFPSLFHLGAMNWMPNEEGMKWFLAEVWPMVYKTFPRLKLYLAGRHMPDWIYNTTLPNIEVTGEVDDAFDFMYSKAIEIVPLFSGSGIRIKIIEGMAARKAVISTSIGAEGINVNSGKNIIIANTPEDFLQAIKKLVSDKQLCVTLGENARVLIEEEHDNHKLIQRLEKFYHKIMAEK